MVPRTMMSIALALSAAVTALFFLVPFLSPNGSFVNLDGTPGIIDHWDIWSEKDPLTSVAYTIGDLVCHQQMSRTIILNGSEMPVCIRDLGLLMGFMFGSLITTVYFGHPMIYRYARPFVVIAFLLIFTDWLIQYVFDLNIPFTRMATGLLAGAGFSLIIYCWMLSIYGSGTDERKTS